MSPLSKVEANDLRLENLSPALPRFGTSPALALLLVSTRIMESPQRARGTYLGALAYGSVTPERFVQTHRLLRAENGRIEALELPDWFLSESGSQARLAMARSAVADYLAARYAWAGGRRFACFLRDPAVTAHDCRCLMRGSWLRCFCFDAAPVVEALLQALEPGLPPCDLALRVHTVLDAIAAALRTTEDTHEGFAPLAEAALAQQGLSIDG